MKEYDHGGNIYEASKLSGLKISEITDLSSNVSPFIPAELLKDADLAQLVSVLPEPYSQSLIYDISKYHDIPEETVIAGGGSTEFIQKICSIYQGKNAMIIQPTYVDYMKYAKLADMKITNVVMPEKKGFAYDDTNIINAMNDIDVCFICNPNNPTGTIISKDDIRFLADMFKQTLFVIDESYIEFCIDKDLTLIGCALENMVILRSFSKAYGMPGLRAGYVFTRNRLLANQLRESISPWSVSTPAQYLCHKALKEIISPEIKQIQDIKRETVIRLSANENLTLFNGHANFILIKLKKSDSASFCEYMLKNGFLVRDCSNFIGLNGKFIRIATKEQDRMERFCVLTEKYFNNI